MLFNSFEFLVFFPVVFALYWLIKDFRLQNVLILISSYVFYGWWSWKFLSLLIFSSVLDYFLALKISETEHPRKRKLLLFISLFANLGLLGVFKYAGFFVQEFSDLLELLGFQANISSLNLIIPVGISFYTFQTLSYTVDVYRKVMPASTSIVSFLSYVSYFPQLVAGPIERAKNLLPQFLTKRQFSYELAADGMKQILWGFFKKIVIADNCAIFVNQIFNQPDYSSTHSLVLIIGVVLFAFQIYGDFSGYSDIAIGTSKLFGITLMRNFNVPYFSRDIAEFWRRWHISLSTWFRDYLYIPLGGSQISKSYVIRNVFIVFIVSGFWHGPAWTFIFWGLFHALLFVPLYMFDLNRRNLDTVANGRAWPSIKETSQIVLTFTLVCIGWVFFRAQDLGAAFQYLGGMATNFQHFTDFLAAFGDKDNVLRLAIISILVLFMVYVEWVNRQQPHNMTRPVLGLNHWLFYTAIFLLIIYYGEFNETSFIYFQF